MLQHNNLNKKSQGLSLNVIIIAAVVLIVLIVLWAIFTGRMGSFNEGIDLVTSQCKIPGTERVCCEDGSLNVLDDPPSGRWLDCKAGQKCCSSVAIATEDISGWMGIHEHRAVDINPD